MCRGWKEGDDLNVFKCEDVDVIEYDVKERYVMFSQEQMILSCAEGTKVHPQK
jgi:hypothetical protein